VSPTISCKQGFDSRSFKTEILVKGFRSFDDTDSMNQDRDPSQTISILWWHELDEPIPRSQWRGFDPSMTRTRWTNIEISIKGLLTRTRWTKTEISVKGFQSFDDTNPKPRSQSKDPDPLVTQTRWPKTKIIVNGFWSSSSSHLFNLLHNYFHR